MGIDPTAILNGLITSGPIGLFAAGMFILYLRSDKRNQELTDKLLEMGTDMVGAMKDLTNVVNSAIRGRSGGQ